MSTRVGLALILLPTLAALLATLAAALLATLTARLLILLARILLARLLLAALLAAWVVLIVLVFVSHGEFSPIFAGQSRSVITKGTMF
jgi:hypothetical protein